jgi:hypothetical protein
MRATNIPTGDKRERERERERELSTMLSVLQFHKDFYNIITCSNYEITYISTTYAIKCN